MDPRFAAYLAVVTLLIITPGPDMALVTRNAFVAGRRAASLTAAGVGIGSSCWAIASILGIAVVLKESLIAFIALKIAGASYLCFLGIRSLLRSFHKIESPPPPLHRGEHNGRSDLGYLRQGLLGNLLNPKAAVIFVTLVPQFIHPHDAPARLFLMMVAFQAILLIWLNFYGYVLSRAGRSKAAVPVRLIAERVTGTVLIGLGVRLALDTR